MRAMTLSNPGEHSRPDTARPFRHIVAMLQAASGEDRRFPPTLLYNEGWLLRLVLDWFATTGTQGHVLSFAPGARWFSEARLASRFMARAGNPASRSQAEGFTHADGVIGHFELGSPERSDAVLSAQATQFVVTEAKLGSALSAGTKNAPDFDQAARNVACMAHLCARHGVTAAQLDRDRFAFVVLAPRVRIENQGIFKAQLDPAALQAKVHARERAYLPEVSDDWLARWFDPLLVKIQLKAVSWESVIEIIGASEPDYATELNAFYAQCLRFNRIDDASRIE